MNLKPEELVSSLRCCAEGDCWCCRLHNDAHRCQETLLGSAAELIERLEKEKATLINTIRGFCRHCKNVDVDENCCRAWVGCSICSKDCPCAGCRKGSKWEWKGVDKE